MSRPRPHPAKALIVGNGRTLADVAESIGYNPHLLGRVLNRRVQSWPRIRRALSDELGVPESELFDDDAAVAA